MAPRFTKRCSAITASLLVALAAQSSGPARADGFGDNSLVKENLTLCFDDSSPAAKRIENCTFVIDRASKASLGRASLASTYLARARAFQQNGDDPAALRDFDSARTRDPDSRLPWIGLGNFYMEKHDYPHALESYDRALQIRRPDPRNDLSLYDNRGAALESLGRHDEAIADFTHALALDPHDSLAYSNRATAYLASNRQELAIADLTAVIRDEPANGHAFYERGTAYERGGALDNALADYRNAVRLNPGLAPAAAALGRLLVRKDPNAALAELSDAIQLDPRSPALRSRAMLYLSLGQPEKAVADFDQVIANDGTDGAAFLNRGVAKAKLGNLADAIDDYTRSIELAPSTAAHIDRGDAYAHLHREEDALADFDTALEAEPRNVTALLGRANADYARKRLGASLDDYTRLIEVDPKNAMAFFKRGNIHLDLKEYRQAFSDYSMSLQLDPNQAAVLYNRSIAGQRLGRSADVARDQRLAKELERAAAGSQPGPAGSPSSTTPPASAAPPASATPAASTAPPAPTAPRAPAAAPAH